MVFDADARRSAAVNRLARWSDRAQRWGRLDQPGAQFPPAKLARSRRKAAERAVERAAVRDVLAGRYDPAANAVFVRPADLVAARVPAWRAAVAHYAWAAHQLAGLVAAAGWRTPPEGLSPQHRSGQMRRAYDDDPGR